MYHPGGSGLPVQSAQSGYCLKLQVVTLTLDKCKTIENQKRMEQMSVASTFKTMFLDGCFTVGHLEYLLLI